MPEEQILTDLEDILGDQSFDMSDDGEIEVDLDALREAPAETTTEEPAAEAPAAEAPAQEHDWEQRYQNLEPEFTRKSQRLAELEKEVLPGMQSQIDQLVGRLEQVAGREDPNAPADDRVEIPENFGQILQQDPGAGATIIAEIADRVAARKLTPILERVAPMLEDWELESELKAAALVEGREDFFELLPTMRDLIVRSTTDLSFDQAYELASTIGKVGGQQQAATQVEQTQTEAPAPSTDRISPEEAQQRATRLAPDTGVSGEVQPGQRVAGSIEEAFNMAVEDVLEG
jgi:hypothetical protein